MEMISDNDITKIIGLTVECKVNNNLIIGVVYSLIKSKNMIVLICNNPLVNNNSLASYLINLNYIESIKIADIQLNIETNDITLPNLEKVFEDERMNYEKDLLLKRADKSNFLYKTYQKGYAIYDKLSKMYQNIILIQL